LYPLSSIAGKLQKNEKLLRKVIKENNEELEDFIGDLQFLVFKLSHVFGVDAETALKKRLVEFEQRFPAKFMKKHSFAGNRRVGGIDKKYQK
jgi:NTP pyrophosphatase (non-canonical NTP hydrolase)